MYPSVDSTAACGLILALTAGVTNRLNIGLSYGGDGLIGFGRHVRLNSLPGFLVKYRIYEENYFIPGIAIGYDHQGYGGIADSAAFGYKGYVDKSPGFFTALSKNYLLFSVIQLGFHGGVDLSMEEVRKVRWPDAYVGFDMGFNEELSIFSEYDFGLNVRDPKAVTYGLPQRGFLNAGIRWTFGENFSIEFDAKDILENRERDGRRLGWRRELKVGYVSHL